MSLKDALRSFITQLERFDYDVSSTDRIWRLIFPDTNEKWFQVHVVKYHDTFRFYHIDGTSCPIELTPKGEVREADSFLPSSMATAYREPESVWIPILTAALRSMDHTAKNWIRTNARMLQQYPLNRRFGIMPHSIVRDSLSDIIRVDKDLGVRRCRKFIRLVEEGYFNCTENTTVSSFTANRYFEYCKIAYIAAERSGEHVDSSFDGRSMYQRYADGRHAGLLDIDGDSEREFAEWIDGTHPKKTMGGHPWEIKRGGNTTHIDLSVFHPGSFDKERFSIQLRGESIGRIEETIRMFLAIHNASLPISIADPEAIRKRLLGQDNIGIIPCYDPLHRANQHFRKDEYVFDVMYYDDLGRYKRRIQPYITWEPLPIMKLRDW